jgi:RNA polymerase sigma-70 factor (ECF subfamily)
VSDLSTIAALKLGNQFAFEAVFHAFHPKVYGYVLQKTHSAYIAEEVVQLSFIKLWHYRESLDPDLALSAQVFRVVKTTLIDQLRKEAVRSRLLEAAPRPVSSLDRLEEKELAERIQRVVRNMPGVRQRVFAMSRFKGMSYKEIADTLSISVRTVENHIAQAIKQLRHNIPFF